MIKFVDSTGLSRFLYNCKNLFQALKYKVTSWTSTPSDINYPSEKLVKDSLDTKQDKLISGQNIKTINNQSLLDSGNITIQADMAALEGEDGYIANKVGGYKIEASSDDIRINYSGSFDEMDDPLMPSWSQLISAGMPEHVKVLLKNDGRKLRTYFFDSQDNFLGNGLISYDFYSNSYGPIITGPSNLSFSYFELDATSDSEDEETGIPYAYIHYSPGIIRGEAEITANRVTSISSASTHFEYPSAKAVYDALAANQNVFIATYGTTTYSDIQTAYTAGKVVVMPYRVSSYDRIFYLIENNIDAGFIYFYSYNPETKEIWYCSVNDSNTWSFLSSFVPEDHSKLVTSWQATTDDTHYPSEKLVKDNLDGKESASNKVTSLSSSSTDTQYPSAKCVYDIVGNIETLLASI